MPRKAEPKEPVELSLTDDKPRLCMYHGLEMQVVPPTGTVKYGMRERKVLKCWVCSHKPKCSYVIYIVE